MIIKSITVNIFIRFLTLSYYIFIHFFLFIINFNDLWLFCVVLIKTIVIPMRFFHSSDKILNSRHILSYTLTITKAVVCFMRIVQILKIDIILISSTFLSWNCIMMLLLIIILFIWCLKWLSQEATIIRLIYFYIINAVMWISFFRTSRSGSSKTDINYLNSILTPEKT